MSYCELTYNDDESRDFKRVSDYDLGSFDLVSYWETGQLDGLDILSLRLRIEGQEHSDYLAGPLTLPLVSGSFASYLAEWSSALRFSPVPDSVCTPRLEGFSILECVVPTGPSDDVWVTCGHSPFRIILSEKCARGTRDAQLEGIGFVCHQKLSDFVPPVFSTVR
jgi:hypothetical protein